MHLLTLLNISLVTILNSFRKTKIGQKTISYIGPSTWNTLFDSIKKANSLNTFKHNVKNHHLTWIINNVYMWIRVSVFIYGCVYIYIRKCISVSSFNLWMFSSLFILFCHFGSDLRDGNETQALLPILCYPSHCWCYWCLLAAMFQFQLLYFNF